MTVALIVGCFDPLLAGQVDFIRRAAQMAAEVVVAVEISPTHKPLYPLETRLEAVESAFAEVAGVTARAYDGDLAGLVAVTGATLYMVALRSATDVPHTIAHLKPACDAVGLTLMALSAEPNHSFVTTSLVRDVTRLGGDARSFLP